MTDKDGDQDMSADCIHASTSPDYATEGRAGTLIVFTCNTCGEKVSSTFIPKDKR